MYARTVGDKTLTFGVSGMLFRDALVMYDRQTDTLWAQVTGQAIKGSLQGQTLQPVPSVHATWKEWKTLYPNSQVLKKRGIFRTPYESYNRDPSKLGILGRRNVDDRLPGRERILGINYAGMAIAFPIEAVRGARLVHEDLPGLPVVLVAAADDLPVLVYDRRVAKQARTFALVEGSPPAIRDTTSGTVFRLSDGVAIAGPLEGERLKRVTAHPAFWFGWRGFFPDSKVWQPEKR